MIHFSTLKSLGKVEPKCLKEYADLLSTLIQEFDIRFAEFKALQPQFQLFSTPFAVKLTMLQRNYKWSQQNFRAILF